MRVSNLARKRKLYNRIGLLLIPLSVLITFGLFLISYNSLLPFRVCVALDMVSIILIVLFCCWMIRLEECFCNDCMCEVGSEGQVAVSRMFMVAYMVVGLASIFLEPLKYYLS